jgi:hypothetical protein
LVHELGERESTKCRCIWDGPREETREDSIEDENNEIDGEIRHWNGLRLRIGLGYNEEKGIGEGVDGVHRQMKTSW